MRVGSILRFGGGRGSLWVSTTGGPRKRLWRAPPLRAPKPIELALRPEFTASIVRFYLSELRNLPKPIKVYSVGNVFRYEEPQKGRYREFTQFNAEIIGAPALQGDAEVVTLAIECLRSVGVRDIHVRVGHIGMLRAFLKLPPEDQGKVLHWLDKRDFTALKAELTRLGLERLEAS